MTQTLPDFFYISLVNLYGNMSNITNFWSFIYACQKLAGLYLIKNNLEETFYYFTLFTKIPFIFLEIRKKFKLHFWSVVKVVKCCPSTYLLNKNPINRLRLHQSLGAKITEANKLLKIDAKKLINRIFND